MVEGHPVAVQELPDFLGGGAKDGIGIQGLTNGIHNFGQGALPLGLLTGVLQTGQQLNAKAHLSRHLADALHLRLLPFMGSPIVIDPQ